MFLICYSGYIKSQLRRFNMSEQVTQYYCKIDPIKTGEMIKSYIDRSNIQIKDLARMMSVSQQAVYKWICGESLPSLENIVLLILSVCTS